MTTSDRAAGPPVLSALPGTGSPATVPGKPPEVLPPPSGGTYSSRPGRSRGAGAGRKPPASAPAVEAGGSPGTSRVADGTTRDGRGAGRTFTIALPPGLKLLSLNGREHWAERARRTEALKKAAWAIALKEKIPPLERVAVIAEYRPPTVRRRRDAENIPAPSAKACLDGIVQAGVLIDDECPRYVSKIVCTIGEPFPKGMLVLHLIEVAGLPEESSSRSGSPVHPHRTGGDAA